MSKIEFLSFGGGVQTTALILMDSYDEVIFADTGGELPETYHYMQNVILPFVKKEHIKFTVVHAGPYVDKFNVSTLEEYCIQKKMVPSRMHRWCTDRFKIRPIRRYIKKMEWEQPAIAVMGISYDEVTRIHSPHWKEYTFTYPLIDKKMSRENCAKYIESKGFPVPCKSGCFYCPFQKTEQWKKLYHLHPEYYNRAQVMEQGGSAFPKYVLSGNKKTLQRLAVGFGEGSDSLDKFVDDICDSGHCMV